MTYQFKEGTITIFQSLAISIIIDFEHISHLMF